MEGARPILPQDHLGRYRPATEEYRLTHGLLAANPSATGRQYISSYEAWEDKLFSLSRWGETGSIIAGLGLLTNRITPLCLKAANRLLGPGNHRAASFALSNIFLSVVSSMAMAVVQQFRSDEKSIAPSFGRAWVDGFIYSCPSTLLGMGLLHQYGFGQRLLQDLLLQPVQASFSIGTGILLEESYGDPRSDLTMRERMKMEMGEGLASMILGRPVGTFLRRVDPSFHQRAVPEIDSDKVTQLPHGGIMVKTEGGLFQFGLPMWSNKDVLELYLKNGGAEIPKDRMHHLVPLTCVVDLDFVPKTVGLLAADFPQYNFYVTKGTRYHFVAPDIKTAGQMEKMLNLAHDGPDDATLRQQVQDEYPPDATGVPDLPREMREGFGAAPASARREIDCFDGDGVFGKNGVVIRKIAPLTYDITDQGKFIGRLDLRKYLPKPPVPQPQTAWKDPELQKRRREVLQEGKPALWPLGTGHGYALGENTSGFMIWNRGKVVLVDPPTNTLEYFAQNGLPLEAIDGVVLTHGHSDHYGPAIPELLRALPKIKVHTTPTIFKMLQRQYQLALGGRGEGLIQWNFVPLLPQRFTEINGLHFRADYSFHVIPTIGFEIYTRPDLVHGKPVVCFTGDSYADVEGIWKHTEGKDGKSPIMSRERAQNIIRYAEVLKKYGKETPPPVILVEGGVPTIHTPPESTRTLLDRLVADGANTSNVFVYHIDSKAAEKARVPKWKAGHEGFIDLSGHLPDAPLSSQSDFARRALDQLPILDSLHPPLKDELLRTGRIRAMDAGELFIREGSTESQFYILLDGEVEVSRSRSSIALRPNGLFGEAALVDEPRNADVRTTTPSLLLEVDTARLTPYTRQLLQEKVRRVRNGRRVAPQAISLSSLASLPPSLQDLLFSVGEIQTVKKGERLIRRGARDCDVYLVQSGQFDVRNPLGFSINRQGPGGMFGEMALVNNAPRSATVVASTDATVLRLPADALEHLMGQYPGVAIALSRTAETRSSWN